MKSNDRDLHGAYLTWGCADDLTHRLKKTLYYSDETDCYETSSAALTDVAVSMVLDVSTNPKRKLTHRYASSLSRHLPISPCALMMGILYSERLRQISPYYLDRVSSSDMYVISMLVASKFLVDEGEDDEVLNDEWAEAGELLYVDAYGNMIAFYMCGSNHIVFEQKQSDHAGLGVSTVNKLEREFLDALDWKIYVHPKEFIEFCGLIETKIAYKCGLERGWFSYTDLSQVLIATQYQKILRGIMENTVKMIGGCALIYGMSLSILATSMLCYASHNAPPRDAKTISHCSNNDFMMDSTSTYSRRCFTRLRSAAINTPGNISSYYINDGAYSTTNDDDLANRLNDDAFMKRNQSSTKCPCLPQKDDCFDAGFNILRPTSVSLIPNNVASKRKFLCNWQFKEPFRECACNKDQLTALYRSSFTQSDHEHILNAQRKRFYTYTISPSPTLFGMVVM